MKDKPRNNGQWTEARFVSFIKSLLRKGTQRWGPKNAVLHEAKIDRGIYLCNECKQHVPVTVKIDNKRLRNVFVDHVSPIIDPEVGFTDWNEYVEKMFCEKDNLQVLCGDCHDKKTAAERRVSVERAKLERESID
jgi:5-methylcytosine-specific restriction endonuclease McrA